MAADAAPLRVEVVYAQPGRAWCVQLLLPEGTTAAEAIARSGLQDAVPGFDRAALTCAVFGKPIGEQALLRDGDRLELLRPLIADPKLARRRRAQDARDRS